MNINWDSSPTKWQYFFQGGVLQLRQPNVRPTGVLKEIPHKPSCGYQPSEQRWSPQVHAWIGKGLQLFFQLSPNSWVVFVLCEAESLRGAPQTPQSTVKVLGGFFNPLLRPTWFCDGFMMNPRVFGLSWCWMRLRKQTGMWGEEREGSVREKGAQMVIPMGMKFDLRRVMFSLKGFWEVGCLSDVGDESCFVGDWGFDCGFDCGCD